MGYAINPCAIFDFANQTTHTDVYTFDKRTYQNARNFSPAANEEYAQMYRAKYPNKPVPASAKSSSSKGSKTYTVRKGDTLGRIAARNGTKIATICKLNGISSKSTLRPGQKLRLR